MIYGGLKRVLLSIFMYSILAVLFSGCSAEINSIVRISGSTSVQPLMQELADEYYKRKAFSKINIKAGGSSFGIKDVSGGRVDMGMSSRYLNEYERKVGLIETKIAIDGIAVIVNPKSSINNLSLDKLRKIYLGEIRTWNEISGENNDLVVISREEGSGTKSAFQEKIGLNKDNFQNFELNSTVKYECQDGNLNVRNRVSEKNGAIGYISLGMVNHSVKAISIDNVEPTIQNIKQEKYKLYRPFILLNKGTLGKESKEFMEFILSRDGQRLISKKFIPSMHE